MLCFYRMKPMKQFLYVFLWNKIPGKTLAGFKWEKQHLTWSWLKLVSELSSSVYSVVGYTRVSNFTDIFCIYLICMSVCTWTCVHITAHMWPLEDNFRYWFAFLPCASKGSQSGHQAWQQVPLPSWKSWIFLIFKRGSLYLLQGC